MKLKTSLLFIASTFCLTFAQAGEVSTASTQNADVRFNTCHPALAAGVSGGLRHNDLNGDVFGYSFKSSNRVRRAVYSYALCYQNNGFQQLNMEKMVREISKKAVRGRFLFIPLVTFDELKEIVRASEM